MKKAAVSLALILALLLLAFTCSVPALADAEYTDQPDLAQKIENLLQGAEPIFSNTEEKFGVGSRLNPAVQYYMWKEDGYLGQAEYAYAQAAYLYLFGELPEWGDHLSKSSLIPSVKMIGRLSNAMLRNSGVGCGAYLRTTNRANGDFSEEGHSMIILAYDEETLTCLHGDTDGNGLVELTTWTWHDFNESQLAGVGRCVMHIIQPNETAWTKSPIQQPATLEFREISYPATYRINLFHSWLPISGTLFTSADASLESVQAVIIESDGTIIYDTGTVLISGNTYNIKTLDERFYFKWISEEGQYFWILNAKDSAGRSLQMVLPVTAVASGTTKIDIRSMEYPDSDADPDIPEWENEWVYKVVTPYGLNMRSIAGAAGEFKAIMSESDLFTVHKKVKADDYTWGYGISSDGATGWAVVDNEWTSLLSSRVSDPSAEAALQSGKEIPGDTGDANGDGKLNREDILLMIRYYAGESPEILLQNCDLDQDGAACTLEDLSRAIDLLVQ